MINKPKVSIHCLVYNHEPYLRKCLDGFVMQKTDFAFEVIVHDDCSTDGSPAIIKEYAEAYPDIIKPIFEIENQYSKNGFSGIDLIMSAHTNGKYIALCEGDDYWIDPYKLQKQVDFLEAHPECTMVCNRTNKYSEKNRRFIGDSFCMEKNGFLQTKDIVRKGGLYISTCSIIYRSSLLEDYPDYCKQCHVGDYPLQIMAAMKGNIYYLDDPMSVYRVENPSSWVGSTVATSIMGSYLDGSHTEVRMLKGFANDYKQFKNYFYQRIAFYITSLIYIYRNDNRSVALIKDEFHDEIYRFGWIWKLRLFFSFHTCFGFRKVYSLYYRLFVNPHFN